MSIISEVKCARCDRKYSGVRSRCPYCGARRIGSGKYSEEGDNSKGKMIIGILVLAVLVVAAGVLLFTAPRPEDESPPSSNISDRDTHDQADDSDTISMPGNASSVPPSSSDESETDSEEPAAPTSVASMIITYAGQEKTDFTGYVGERVSLRVKIEPPGLELTEEVIWQSSDTSVFEVVKDNTEGTAATVTIIGTGSAKSATLTASIGGVEAKCTVRVS